jgi:hypothetical protein
MCLRNIHGVKTNPLLPLRDLKLPEIEKIFPRQFLAQLKRIYLCGNYGDPLMARDLLPALQYFRAAMPGLRLEMMTNGSARSPEWWAQLAATGVGVYFGIDGADETSSIYRRNTDFQLVMRNAAAFIAAGGKAYWDFIVFRHNEHQVAEARALSEKMGFVSFRPKRTGRFFSNQKSAFRDRQEVWDENGSVEYYLEKPLSPEYLNPSLEREAALTAKHGSFDSYLEQTAVDCKVAAEKSVFVTAEGLVFPCCWTAIQLYPWYTKPQGSEMWRALSVLPHGLAEISALERPLAEIVDGDFFQNIIPGSWAKSTFADGKLKVCARICGKEFDPFRDQFGEV